MKKLFALLIAALMLLSLATVAFAEGEAAEDNSSAESGESSEEIIPDEFEYTASVADVADYNFGETISTEITFTFNNIPEIAQGLSVINFCFRYDMTQILPAVVGAEDEDGFECDYTAYVSGMPEEWKAFGGIGEDALGGWFEFAIWDDMSGTVIESGDSITVEIPFTVLEDATASSLEIAYDDILFYSADLKTVYNGSKEVIALDRALQPSESVLLPENALPLDIAGYKHAANNVIYYAESDITVGEYIASYIEITNNQNDMNYFAIAIVDGKTNKITYTDSVIGRPQSDKSQVVIPAGSYIIGVNGNKTEDFNAFKNIAEIGKVVTLYNVNLEPTGLTEEGTELKNAGFTVTYEKPDPYLGMGARYDEEEDTVFLYVDGVDRSYFDEMFINEVIVFDKDGNELGEDGKIVTGMTVGDGTHIVVLGDVNADGIIDQFDYILIRRHYFETYELTGDCLRAACIYNGETVETFDYIFVKRAYFGSLRLTNLM